MSERLRSQNSTRIFTCEQFTLDDLLVGMLAFCHEDDPEDLELFWIFRLMIDRHHQGNGYGIDAMRLAIEQIRKLGATRVRTMHKPENSAAAAIYAKLGIPPSGQTRRRRLLA